MVEKTRATTVCEYYKKNTKKRKCVKNEKRIKMKSKKDEMVNMGYFAF